MRKKAFEKLLREAILLEAEERGAKIPASTEPIPAEAQARFDAALNGPTEQRQAVVTEASLRSEKPRRSWLSYGIAAVGPFFLCTNSFLLKVMTVSEMTISLKVGKR